MSNGSSYPIILCWKVSELRHPNEGATISFCGGCHGPVYLHLKSIRLMAQMAKEGQVAILRCRECFDKMSEKEEIQMMGMVSEWLK